MPSVPHTNLIGLSGGSGSGVATACAATTPGAIVHMNVSEDVEEGIAVASDPRAASDTKKGSPVTQTARDVLDFEAGGQIVDTQEDIPVAVDTSADADSIAGRKPRRGNRSSSTLRQVAGAVYNTASSMFQGTRVTSLGAEFPEQHRQQHRCTSGAISQRVQGGISWAQMHHNPQPVPTTAGFHVQPFDPQHPRRGPVVGLRFAIRRRERELGRNLTPEEWQGVRDRCIQRNRLKELGLDQCFINETRKQ